MTDENLTDAQSHLAAAQQRWPDDPDLKAAAADLANEGPAAPAAADAGAPPAQTSAPAAGTVPDDQVPVEGKVVVRTLQDGAVVREIEHQVYTDPLGEYIIVDNERVAVNEPPTFSASQA